MIPARDIRHGRTRLDTRPSGHGTSLAQFRRGACKLLVTTADLADDDSVFRTHWLPRMLFHTVLDLVILVTHDNGKALT